MKHPVLTYLRERRIALGFSQRVVAERVGVDTSQFKTWDSGRANIGLFLLIAWATALDVDLLLVGAAGERHFISRPRDLVVILKTDRREKKLSQLNFAAAHGISRTTLRSWESENHTPCIKHLSKWCAALGYELAAEARTASRDTRKTDQLRALRERQYEDRT